MFGIVLKAKEKRLPYEQGRTPDKSLSGSTLFEALMCELHWTALQIGGVCSIVNSCASSGGNIPDSCRNQFPITSPVIATAISKGGDLNINKSIASRIGLLMQNLADATHMTLPYVGRSGVNNAARPPHRAITQLAVVWRKLCEDALEVINELEPEARWRLNGLYTENVLILGKFLKDASRGKFDGVDVHGEIALPVLAQRRRSPRFALLQPCKVIARGAAYPAFARDISLHGMGITCKSDALKLKDNIVIELQVGRRFEGVVVWSRDGGYGIQFRTALAKNDPLILG